MSRYHALPVAPTQDPQDLPVEKLLEHFTKGDSASALAHRRVLNDIGVTAQSAPNAASVRAAGPLSGRRSKPPAPKPAGGSKVGDGDLLTSMVQRLNALERKMAEQRNLLVEKDAEIAELRARQEERNDDARLVAELTDENIKLKRRQLEMEKFLADYGLGAHAHLLRAPCAHVATNTCITLVLAAQLGSGTTAPMRSGRLRLSWFLWQHQARKLIRQRLVAAAARSSLFRWAASSVTAATSLPPRGRRASCSLLPVLRHRRRTQLRSPRQLRAP